jgi:hypothetical protein
VFHQFIPLKPTGWFELYLTQEHTRDGVLDFGAIVTSHPFANAPLQVAYTEQGEAAFLAPYRALALASVRRDPWRFARFVLNRAVNALVWARWSTDASPAFDRLPPQDEAQLAGAGLAMPRPGGLLLWLGLDLSPGEFLARLRPLALAEPQHAYRSWLATKAAVLAWSGRPIILLAALALSGLPTLCFLGTVLLRRLRTGTAVWFAGFIYLVALLPNLLLTHDHNHQAGFLGLHAAIVAAFVAALLELLPLFRAKFAGQPRATAATPP